jgi:choline dehydrogenase
VRTLPFPLTLLVQLTSKLYRAYVRGSPDDYDSWAKLVNDDRWSFNRVLSVFKRMERREFDIPEQTEKKFHGEHGVLSVSVRQPVHATAVDFVQAAKKTGATIGDYNGAVQMDRAGYLQQTVRNGERLTAADAYIWNNLHRPNLEVVCHALAHRVLFKKVNGVPQAYAVEYSLPDGAKRVVECLKEVIVSCSAVGTPALLMRSGIGAKQDLARFQIESVVDNPEVGRNLEDHVFLPILVSCKKGKEQAMRSVNKGNAENIPGALPALTEWARQGTGLLASSAYDATYFFKTGVNETSPLPDAQIGLFVSPANSDLFQKNLRFADMRHHPAEMMGDDGEGFIFVSTLLHPFSKGYVELKSKDPKQSPRIFPNYFVDERDLEALARICVKSVALARNMELAGEVMIPADLKHLPLDSVQLWKEMCRRYATTLYHPASTCKMGAVTNSDLTVKGVRGLRVADASVMPHVTSGNTNAPSILVGEVCADIIAEVYRLTLGGPQPEAPSPISTLAKIAGVAGAVALVAQSARAKL